MRSLIKSRLGRGLLLALGVALFLYLFSRVGLRAALVQAVAIGWMFGVVFLLGGLPHLFRTLAWRLLLRQGGEAPGLGRLLAWWLAGEAISHLSFSWSGEAYRVVVARPRVTTARGTVAMALSRAVYALASLLVSLVGLSVGLSRVALPAELQTGILRLGVVLAALFALAAVSFIWWRTGRRQPAPGAKASWLTRTLGELRAHLQEMSFRRRGELAYLFGLNLLAALVGVAEVWLILRALGAPVDLGEALFIEGFLKLLSGLAYFVPGNIGVAEGGIVLILRLLEVSAASALALALVRRARALAWVGVGGLVLLGLGTGLRAGPAEESLAAEQSLENARRG